MNRGQLVSCRYGITLFFSILCLLVSSCAGGKQSALKTAADDLARIEQSTKELRKLAEGGDASAQNELGLLYYEGKGIPQNHRKAKEWFDKAVEQGHTGAQVNLGTLYLRGEGAPQSSQMALFWFSRAAAQEDTLAFAKLGLMYAQGRGVLQDFIQAHMWYNLSAAHGETRSADARDALAKQMTPAQIAEAQRLAREWRPREDKSRKTVY
ncbi:MAG TPA: tetratricopeptide repeat protein [Nitrospira sp.]|nr:tetratricopeptide repeat protein [Nitrospira sp.]